jgi:uncharacterized membrane protein YkoI
MTIRTITVLSIPLWLLACGGAETPAGLDTPAPSARAPSSSPSTSAQPSSVDARQVLLAQLASASITLDQATDSALAANPGSQVLEADLDGSGADVRYEIELRLADGQVVEVHVDATTGAILDTRPEDDDGDDDDDAAVDCTGAISALQAQEIAEAEAVGTAVEVEIDDGCEFEITVDTGAGFVEVEVAPDGSVRQVEPEDDGPDGDADDDDDDDSDGDD